MTDNRNPSIDANRSANITYDAFWHGQMALAKSVFSKPSRLLERRLNWHRILYVQYTNPGCYPPLHHSSRILANADWDVLFFGKESFGSSSILNLPPDPRIRQKKSSSPAGGLLKLHYLWFCVRVLWQTFLWRPAWLYASDMLSYPAALLILMLTKTRVILHEHDYLRVEFQVNRSKRGRSESEARRKRPQFSLAIQQSQ
jgi:hypothetical protein